MLEDAVADAARSNVQHGLLLLEPDHYQRLLHEIGLDAADTMLAAMAERLQAAIGDDAIAARFSEQDRKSTRLNSSPNAHLVCRLLLEKTNNPDTTQTNTHIP